MPEQQNHQIADISGHWKRTAIDNHYDDFWRVQGQSWIKRKLAAKGTLTRIIVQNGYEVEKDMQVFGGLLTVEGNYHLHKNEKEAMAARSRGECFREEANGMIANLVAWYDEDDDAVVLHRTFEGHTFQVYYRHTLQDKDTLVGKFCVKTPSEEVNSTVTFRRTEPHHHHIRRKLND